MAFDETVCTLLDFLPSLSYDFSWRAATKPESTMCKHHGSFSVQGPLSCTEGPARERPCKVKAKFLQTSIKCNIHSSLEVSILTESLLNQCFFTMLSMEILIGFESHLLEQDYINISSIQGCWKKSKHKRTQKLKKAVWANWLLDNVMVETLHLLFLFRL